MPLRFRVRATLALALSAALLTALAPALVAEEAALTEDEKILYALGFAMAGNLQQLSLTEEELVTVQRGIADGALAREAEVDLQEWGPKLQAALQARASKQAETEKVAGSEHLAMLAAEEGAETTESGLVYRELTAGDGASPAASDKVSVHYVGELRDGTVFDSSRERGQPATFPLTGVIRCWTEGLQKMKVGGTSVLGCPSDIAYGDQGRPGIPGGAALVFEVELLGIEGTPAAAGSEG